MQGHIRMQKLRKHCLCGTVCTVFFYRYRVCYLYKNNQNVLKINMRDIHLKGIRGKSM
jgi:hypothetical protein